MFLTHCWIRSTSSVYSDDPPFLLSQNLPFDWHASLPASICHKYFVFLTYGPPFLLAYDLPFSSLNQVTSSQITTLPSFLPTNILPLSSCNRMIFFSPKSLPSGRYPRSAQECGQDTRCCCRKESMQEARVVDAASHSRRTLRPGFRMQSCLSAGTSLGISLQIHAVRSYTVAHAQCSGSDEKEFSCTSSNVLFTYFGPCRQP